MSSVDQLSRIRGLLRKAEADGVTAKEAEALTDKALALSAKYRIDWALAKNFDADASSTEIVTRNGRVNRPFFQMFVLVAVVYRSCDCEIITTGDDTYTAHGTKSDLDKAEVLLTSLLIQGTREVLRHYHSSGASGRGERRSTYKRSWYNGYSYELKQRFDKAQREAEATIPQSESSGVELALLDKKSRVQRSIDETHSRLRKRTSRGTTGSGYRDGREAGARANLGLASREIGS